MIKLNREELRDKIYACWLGKNIGGTIGAPYEGQRNTNDCKGFSTEPGKPLPNDDLDLQLVWLKAMYEVGPYSINSDILGEYWSEYIVPYWSEYGNCKSNMRRGLMPPISGQYENIWKNSNGAWIRTEIWATMFPCDLEKAIYCAFEDASVDHGVGDGTYAAVFVAAMESAAFAVNDIRELIKIGLSNIPQDCRFARFINAAVECYDSGMTWLEARNKLTDMALADPELGWFQAPANVGYVIIALLYGEGDFKKTVLTACNCGDDTDCTCATAASILGIMNGTSVIPEDWKKYIGDDITTVSVNVAAVDTYRGLLGGAYKLPATCTELTDSVMAIHPLTLFTRPVKITDEETKRDISKIENLYGNNMNLFGRKEYFTVHKYLLATYTIELSKEPLVKPLEEISVKVTFKNNFLSQKNFICSWKLPEGWSVSGQSSVALNRGPHEGTVQSEYIITAGENIASKNTLILEIACDGHHEIALIPVVLLG